MVHTDGNSHSSWRVRAIAAVVALAVVGLLAEGARRTLLVISVGAGLKAGHMCSAVFVAGRTPDAVLRDELADLHPKLDFVARVLDAIAPDPEQPTRMREQP